MAKKVVATLKREGASRQYTKVVKMVKKGDSDAYSFEEKVMPKDMVDDFLKK